MKNLKHIIYTAIFIIFAAFSAFAHPLGNFSVNQFSRLEVEKTQIQIKQVLDMAEIPTFQAKDEIDTDENGAFSKDELNTYAAKITPNYLSNLSLNVNNQTLLLRADSQKVSTKDGAGNLPTLRIEWNFIADSTVAETNIVKFENKNFAERIGWNEIIVNQTNGINIFNSSIFGNTLSDELKTYPENLLNAPLSERKAEFSFTSNTIPANAKALQNRDGNISIAVQKDRFAELVSIPEITPTVVLFALLLAFGLGAMHALSPGHGKTVVGAYLVGSRGTVKHALFLGLTVTITHTIGVFALGLITLFASNYILPEKIMPFLTFVSGLMVFYIGVTLFKDRFLSIFSEKDLHSHHTHSHGEDSHTHGEHSHTHGEHSHGGKVHSHLPPEEITWKNLLGLGISGGLLPCPSALVLMLSAISLNRTGYGVLLTFMFSLGLAATLTSIGLIFLYLGKIFGDSKFGESKILKGLPVFSAFVIACFGAVICYNALV
jgi:nickel/cobalt transporter (NicO) family protein